jgi:hypothetical protein
VKKVFPLLILVLAGWKTAQSQTTAYQPVFQDSLRLLLANTHNLEAETIGTAFSVVWGSLGPDQQQIIKTQLKVMKRKGYKLRPHTMNYLASIVNAINLEKLDLPKLNNFLTVSAKVIAREPAAKVNDFFAAASVFFEYHSLNYDKSFRLRVSDDAYVFDFVEPPAPPSPTDTVEAAPVDTTTVTLPAYLIPEPQPDLTGPVIRFTKLSLNFSTSYDSTTLKNTKGTFSLRDHIFVGEGGRFDWSSAGLSPDSVFYDLAKFNFRTSTPALRAGQGKLTYAGKLPGVVQGTFEFKSVSHKKDAATYPRFASYKSDVNILGLGSDKLKYTGGFGLLGAHENSQSVSGQPAILEMGNETERQFKAVSTLFEFKDSTVTSAHARVIIYQGNDTLYHPSMYFSYDFGKQHVTLIKDKSGLRKAPFSSSYFNVDFSADEIVWDLKSDSFNIFNPGSSKVAPVVIESSDFYDPEDYRILRGSGFRFHPLVIVANYATTSGLRDFTVYDLVGNYAGKYSMEELKSAMEFLSQKGMILYESSTGKIHVKEKTIHVVESARGHADYDNLKIQSLTDRTANATVNLKKEYMTVRGVDEFNVSDSLNVVIKPDSSVITIMKDRDIKFNGTITAGNFEITGKDFMLKYDSFFINLNHIDSIRFYVTEKNGTRRRVNNSMVGADSTAAAAGGLAGTNKTSGTLYINRPDNKSGKDRVPNYPRLDASAGGVIYFDRQEVLNGAYDRSVFFVVPPFKLDSLNDADPASINFEGTFVTNGMFPSFQEKLHTMADKSLGFTHAVPPSGYSLYKGEGKLFGGLNLDNSGIRAVGRIEYLAASAESNDFVFYPDSVIGKGTVGEIKEKQFGSINFPQVTFSEFKMKWLPKQDQLKFKNLRDPFSLYSNTATLNGTLTVSKTGVAGSGKLTTRGSEVASRQLSFSSKELGARHASFQAKTDNPDKPALAGEDVRLKFDLGQNFATISPEVEGTAAIEFPYAQFKTSIPEARWDLNTQKIVMTKAADVPLENSYFYTTRKELDSLNFNAEKAEYDIRTQQLKVSGIPYIIVADAKITPENNEVLILENAKIGQLKNTTIVIDTLNGYHRLTQGVVDIVSRNEFGGYATYQYVNSVNDTFAIKMTDFHLENIPDEGKTHRRDKSQVVPRQTVANGSVSDKDHLLLAPRIYYKGDMTMYASKPALQLKGFVKLDLKKIKNYNTWLVYEQSGDEKDVYMNFDKAITEDGKNAEAGLHFAADNSLYVTFVSDKKNSDDEDFFVPSGSLYFDKQSTEFLIQDREKAAGTKLSGKVFAYNEEKQEVRFEGPVNFFKGFKDFSLTSSVLGSGNLETNDIKLNAFIIADINLPPQAFQIMATRLQEIIKAEGSNDGLGDQTELLYKIADIVGEKTVKDYEQKSLQSYVSLSTIPILARPIVFANVSLKYSQKAKGFYNEGTIGVSNIGRSDVNGAFEGFMEIRRNEDGTPVFHVFFKAAPDAWYYFGYEDNRLMIQSSDQALNAIISKKTNAAKAKVGDLVFIPGSDEETLAFINKFRLTYYGIEAPYELNAASSTAEKKEEEKKPVEKKKEEKKDDKEGF